MGIPERSDHISTKFVLFKVGLKVPTPKHEVVAAEGTAKGESEICFTSREEEFSICSKMPVLGVRTCPTLK